MRYISLAVVASLALAGCSSKEVKPAKVEIPKVEVPKVLKEPKKVKVVKPMRGTIITSSVSGGETAYANKRADYTAECQRQDAKGCERLAIVYGNGLGVAKNTYKSFELYTKSCELGDAWSCGIVGDMLKEGKGTVKNLVQSTLSYQKGCELDSGIACNAIGNSYLHGRGTTKDINQAIKMFEKSISLGHNAYTNLGFAYRSQGNENKAKTYYKKACDLKDEVGCGNLAILYEDNKNYSFSYPYYVLACNYGDAEACNSGTMMIFNKKEGVNETEKTMYQLAARSCDLGNKTGCSNLAYLYENGMGVAQSVTLASKYYKKACQLGDKKSCGK